MNKLVFKTFLILILVFTSFAVLLGYKSDQYVDRYYSKFLRKSESLIIGSSRAFFGISPRILGEGFSNFAFNMKDTPYGEIYSQAILKKISFSKKSRFVIEVNPYLFAKRNDIEGMREAGSMFEDLYVFNMQPNYDYLFRFYEKSLSKILLHKKKKTEDYDLGWYPIIGKSNFTKSKIEKCINDYTNIFSKSSFSDYRLVEFKKLVEELRDSGEVLLVRSYILEEFYELENSYFNQFDLEMEKLAKELNLRYLDLNRSDLFDNNDLNDCHHLKRSAAIKMSTVIKNILEEK